jgi:hypothetical protein
MHVAELAAQAGGHAWIRFPVAALSFYLFQLAYNVHEMKDLWCSSTDLK